MVDCREGEDESSYLPAYLGISRNLLKDYRLANNGNITQIDTPESVLFCLLDSWYEEKSTKATLEVADRLSAASTMCNPNELRDILISVAAEPLPNEAGVQQALKALEEERASKHRALSIQHVNRMIDNKQDASAIDRYLNDTSAYRLMSDSEDASSMTTLDDLMQNYLDNYDRPSLVGPLTGIAKLDKTFKSGLTPGSLTLILGEQYIGKTAILLYILMNMYKAGNSVVFASCEQDLEHEIMYRLMSQVTGLPVDELEFRGISADNQKDIRKHVLMGKESVNTFFLSPPEEATDRHLLFSRLRSLVRHHKIDAIGIDYATLIDATGILDTDRARGDQEILALYQTLRGIARRAGCPLIIVHPLTARAPDQRKKPGSLDDVAECKQLRYVATNAIYLEKTRRGDGIKVNILKAKNRRIVDKEFDLDFDFSRMKISDVPLMLDQPIDVLGMLDE